MTETFNIAMAIFGSILGVGIIGLIAMGIADGTYITQFFERVITKNKTAKVRSQVTQIVGAVQTGAFDINKIDFCSLKELLAAVEDSYEYFNAHQFELALEVNEHYSRVPSTELTKKIFKVLAETIQLETERPSLKDERTYSYAWGLWRNETYKLRDKCSQISSRYQEKAEKISRQQVKQTKPTFSVTMRGTK